MTTERTLPEELRLVEGFANTFDAEGDTDELGDPESLRAWLSSRDLIAGDVVVTASDLDAARGLRHALRAILRAHHGEELSEREMATINRSVARYPLTVSFAVDAGPAISPADAGIAGALGQILAGVVVAMANGTWERLKACADDRCQWVFYDHSKNHSKRWCSMQVCGNRTKTRAYRERQKTSPA